MVLGEELQASSEVSFSAKNRAFPSELLPAPKGKITRRGRFGKSLSWASANVDDTARAASTVHPIFVALTRLLVATISLRGENVRGHS